MSTYFNVLVLATYNCVLLRTITYYYLLLRTTYYVLLLLTLTGCSICQKDPGGKISPEVTARWPPYDE